MLPSLLVTGLVVETKHLTPANSEKTDSFGSHFST